MIFILTNVLDFDPGSSYLNHELFVNNNMTGGLLCGQAVGRVLTALCVVHKA